jgi:hypothetical protein
VKESGGEKASVADGTRFSVRWKLKKMRCDVLLKAANIISKVQTDKKSYLS